MRALWLVLLLVGAFGNEPLLLALALAAAGVAGQRLLAADYDHLVDAGGGGADGGGGGEHPRGETLPAGGRAPLPPLRRCPERGPGIRWEQPRRRAPRRRWPCNMRLV